MTVSRVRDLCYGAQGELELGHLTAAEQLAEQALLVSSQELGESHYATGYAACMAGRIAVHQGAKDAALALCTRATCCAEANESDDFENAAMILAQVADLLSGLGHLDEAQRVHERLLDWHARHLGDDHPRYHALRAGLTAIAS